MRKYNFIFMAVLLLACVIAPLNQTRADDVNKQKASQVGAYFLASQFGDKAITAESLIQVYEIRNAVRDIPALYVFNTADKRGCVIVAGSDCMSPIIGYSTEGGFDPTNIPDNLLFWLSGYVDFITYAQNNEMAPSPKSTERWDELLQERLPYFGNNTKLVYTLLTTKWDQLTPYNLLCPLQGGQRCAAGCVATAMGQILKYWGYPVKGQGRKTYRQTDVVPQWQGVNFDTVPAYNYDTMPISLTTGSPTAAQILEVARLLRDIGVTVEMTYGYEEGSGAMPTKVGPSFRNYFKYDATPIYISRAYGQYSNTTGVVNDRDSAWVSILRNEIINKRPVYYGGTDPGGVGRDAGGHAFVCDGYNSSTDKFRFNWGWGGNSNALWFDVYEQSLNTPAAGYHFTAGFGMCYNITPPLDSIPEDLRPGTVGIRQVDANPFTEAIYPNPATEQVTVSFDIPSGNAADLQVLDINGRVIKHFKVQPSSSRLTFSVSDLAPGIYLCRLNGHTSKFIVR